MIVILPLLALLGIEAGSIEVIGGQAESNEVLAMQHGESTEVLEEFEPKKDRLHLNQPINLREEWKLSFQVKNPIYKLL